MAVPSRSAGGCPISGAPEPQASHDLVELLCARARLCPGQTAYTFLTDGENLEEKISYGELDAAARSLGSELFRAGMAGERVLVLCPPGLAYVRAFFGCLYSGAIAVPAYPPRPNRSIERLLAICSGARPRAAITTFAMLEGLERRHEWDQLRALRWHCVDDPKGGGGWEPRMPGSDAVAFLQYTSGSTAEPRGVMLTHGNLLANQRMIQDGFAHTAESVFVGWVPLYHDMGLVGNVLHPLYRGIPCVLLAPAHFLQKPVRWLRAISKYRGTTSGGPNFAYDLCVSRIDGAQCAGLDLSSWDVAYNGAEPVFAETMERFAAAFEPYGFRRDALYPCYGMAEASLIVAGGRKLARYSTSRGPQRLFVSCGAGLGGTRIRIVDPESGVERPAGELGEIWVRSGSVGLGYWGRPELSRQVFGANLEGEPYLRTGDLGYQLEGELFVAGRIKDVLIARGRKLHPEDLERAAEASHVRLRPHASAAFAIETDAGEEIAIVMEVAGRHSAAACMEIARAVRRAIIAETEVEIGRVVLTGTAAVPRTSSGKIQRSLCRERYLAGQIAVIADDRGARPVRDGLAGLVEAAARRPLEDEELELPLFALGLDSLRVFELLAEIEKRTGARVDPALIWNGGTARGLEAAASNGGGAEGAEATGDTPGVASGQRSLWLLERAHPGSSRFHVARAFEIRGGVEPRELEAALKAAIERHPALRTRFPAVDGEPRAEPTEGPASALRVHDVEGQHELLARLRKCADEPFDLAAGPLFRADLFRSHDADVLLLCAHHIAADLYSLNVLIRELAGGPAAHAAAGYSVAGRESALLKSPRGGAAWERLRARLEGAPACFEIPAGRPGEFSAEGARLEFEIGAVTAAGLRRLAAARETTLYAAMLAVFQIALHEATGSEDIVTGAPVTLRRNPVDFTSVGYWINVAAVRTAVQPEDGFGTVLERVRVELAGLLRDREFPFAEVVARLQPARSWNRSPLFEVMFAMQTAGAETPAPAELLLGFDGPFFRVGGWEIAPRALPPGEVAFDCVVNVAERGEGLLGVIEYRRRRFETAAMQRFATRLTEIADQAARQPERRVAELIEAAAPLTGVYRALPAASAGEAIARECERRADRPAIQLPEGIVTYGELDRQAGAIAAELLARGTATEELIALELPPGVSLVAAILGVWRAGAAYVPIDTRLPEGRREMLWRESGARTRIDSAFVRAAAERAPAAARTLDARQLAYAIYTSGSTGKPKCVEVTHGALLNVLESLREELQFSAGHAMLALTGIGFDIAHLELLLPLLAGGRVSIPPEGTAGDPAALALAIAAPGVTHVQATPSTWRMLLDSGWRPAAGLSILAGGEALPHACARALAAGGGAVYNLYGPTETTVWSSVERFDAADCGFHTVALGRPIANTTLHLLDGRMRPVPPNVPGELFIGGLGLARGYRGAPGLTAERFAPDPFGGAGARLYRTGDRARRSVDGRIEFLGRVDRQVKIRGWRVEPGEIEAALRQHPLVKDAAVVVKTNDGGDAELQAFVLADAGAIPERVLREHLRRRFPEALIPARLAAMAEFPRNGNGKLDRGALHAPAIRAAGIAPEGDYEKRIAEIWRDVLGLENVDVDAGFFDLGGHSLLLAKVQSRLARNLGVEVPMAGLFSHGTVRSLAAHISRMGEMTAGEERAPDRSRLSARRATLAGAQP